MKIAWFTPFSNKSGISKYSQSITNELINLCDVDLWLSEDIDLLPTELKIYFYCSNKNYLPRLSHYDFIIFNLGNHLYFHKDIYELSQKTKGIVILHDFVMHHFFAGYYLSHKNDSNKYKQDMKLFYGHEGKKIAIDSILHKCQPIWETEEVIKYPFFERAIRGAVGVITHSQFLADKVKQKYLGPVELINHPFYFDCNPILQSKTRKIDLGIEDKILMLTIGHVNPNKKIDKIIKILGEHKDLAEKVMYMVIGDTHGHPQYYAKLQSFVEKYNLKNTVYFLGFQPDKVLYAYMSNADIFINMRFPAMEGASWSLVEQLYYGKPVIVTDTGFYSELPDDCVMKIEVDRDEAELLNSLKKLIAEDKIRNTIGAKGRQFAIENFSAQKYTQKFINFLDKVKY